MSDNNLTVGQRARTAFNNTRAQAYAFGGLAASAAPFAFAQESGFDSSAITAKITENTATAVAVIGAFIVGIWTLKTMGLLKRG